MRSTFKVLFYLERNKDKKQFAVPVMGRITVNGSIAQFSAKLSVPESLWEVSGGRAKGMSDRMSGNGQRVLRVFKMS